MNSTFDPSLDIHIEIAEDLLECLQAKSKWTMGSWTWVSLSNINTYYDIKSVRTYNSNYKPGLINLEFFLRHLTILKIVEHNPELFLHDKFYRLTREGRQLLEQSPEAVYAFLAHSKHRV